MESEPIFGEQDVSAPAAGSQKDVAQEPEVQSSGMQETGEQKSIQQGSEVQVSEVQEDADVQTTPATEADYAEVLNKYCTALSEEWNMGDYFEEEMSALGIYCYEGNALENVGYKLQDLDGDESPELLIGAIAGDEFVEQIVFEMYTFTDNQPVQIFASQERDRNYLGQGEGGAYIFVNEGSGGAGSSTCEYSMLEQGKLEIVSVPEPIRFTPEYVSFADYVGIASDKESVAETGSSADADKRTTITFVVEGVPEEVPATIYVGDDYTITIPEEGWELYATEAWRSTVNEQVRFLITDYPTETVESLQKQLVAEGYTTSEDGKCLIKQDETDALTYVAGIIGNGETVKSIVYCYPVEAAEGFGVRLATIANSFTWNE